LTNDKKIAKILSETSPNPFSSEVKGEINYPKLLRGRVRGEGARSPRHP
jgi:hypothetical protein